MIFFYTIELEINDTTDTARYASYLDLHVEINDTTDTARYASYLDLHVEIKDTTDTARYASYLDIYVEIDSEGWLRTTNFHCLTLLFNYVVLYAFHSIEQSSKLIPATLNSLLPI